MKQAAVQDFIGFCAAEENSSKVIEAFLETIRLFGFEVAAGGGWTGAGAKRVHRFYFNNWPVDWFEPYIAKGFFEIDPMVIETRRRMTPFLWTEMVNAASFAEEGRIVVDAARTYGWSEVMGIPIHGPAGYQALVTLASLKSVSISPAERSLLRAMAFAVHDHARASVGFGEITRPSFQLTSREAECMHWVAAGKTDLEIGIILGIATATAHFHIEQVKKKVGTRSRSEAIALLVLLGIV
jgi:DNA-binding CsgD family transcriptional regulator